jgi:hypothetical protein
VGSRRQHPGRRLDRDLHHGIRKGGPRNGAGQPGAVEPYGLPGLTLNALRNLHNPRPWPLSAGRGGCPRRVAEILNPESWNSVGLRAERCPVPFYLSCLATPIRLTMSGSCLRNSRGAPGPFLIGLLQMNGDSSHWRGITDSQHGCSTGPKVPSQPSSSQWKRRRVLTVRFGLIVSCATRNRPTGES